MMLGGLAAAALRPSAAFAAHGSATLAPILTASAWLKERPTPASLSGRVVLVDVFTFECRNCTNVTPNLKRLYAAYPRSQFEIVAVHTPEVPSYQRIPAYLSHQARLAALPWPIAIDNDERIWDAYGVSAWPTQLIFDRRGRLTATIVGDGEDERVAAAVGAAIRA